MNRDEAQLLAREIAKAIREPAPDYSGKPDPSWPEDVLLARLAKEQAAMDPDATRRAVLDRYWRERRTADLQAGESAETIALQRQLQRELEGSAGPD